MADSPSTMPSIAPESNRLDEGTELSVIADSEGLVTVPRLSSDSRLLFSVPSRSNMLLANEFGGPIWLGVFSSALIGKFLWVIRRTMRSNSAGEFILQYEQINQ